MCFSHRPSAGSSTPFFLALLHSYLFSKKPTPLCRKLNSQKDLKEIIRGGKKKKRSKFSGKRSSHREKIFKRVLYSDWIGCRYIEKRRLQLFKTLENREIQVLSMPAVTNLKI